MEKWEKIMKKNINLKKKKLKNKKNIWKKKDIKNIIFYTGLIFSVIAYLNTVSVYTQPPSTQSTTTKAPSVTLRAAVTSDEKSTCPGESIRLITYPYITPKIN